MSSILKIYDKVAPDISNYYDKQTHLNPIKEFTQNFDRGAKILDLGCGMGKDVYLFSKLGFESEGVDGSVGMINEARRRYPKEKYVAENISNLKFTKGYFDGVWSWSVLTHLSYDDKRKALIKINEILKNKGIFAQTLWRGRGEFVNHDVYPRRHFLLSISSWKKLYKESGFSELDVKIIKSSWRDHIRLTARKNYE